MGLLQVEAEILSMTISIWFGNFFEPFFSSEEAVRRGIEDVAKLGFTTINLDSKPWEDFFARYSGEPASQYVRMHEFLMQEAAVYGMDYTHLALYLCGDNLYPTIRDVPPVRGEESIRPDGKPMGTYKYWSPKAQATMVEHVEGLLKLYGPGMRRHAECPDRVIMQTMFDPIVKPSFDLEGRERYLKWLSERYGGSIERINQRYGLGARSFNELTANQYWLKPEQLDWVSCARPTAEDFATRSADFYRWVDNQSYLAEETENYFAKMKSRWRKMQPGIFIEPVLHQWGYFFNPPGQTMWQTGQRALDIYRIAPHVDGALYMAAPLDPEDRADAMALSAEGSIMRSANRGRSFTGGLYIGRHVNSDIYSVVPPAEAIGTLVANGATSLHMYGYSGLDDGGVLYRMDEPFKDSLRAGNEWARKVIPLLKSPRAKQVAMVFPAEMSLYEPLDVDSDGRHRMDLLGWYSQLADLGYHVDILHPTQIAAGALADYQTLVISHNSLYDLGDNAALEEATSAFVQQGGTVLHGPHCELARRALGIEEAPVPFDCIQWDEEIIPHGWSTVQFRQGDALGSYIRDEGRAIAETRLGEGRVISFGFQYGYSYCRKSMPIVPPAYGKREMHPIVLLRQTPVAAILGPSPLLPIAATKGIEVARFGNQCIIVNHRPTPLDLSTVRASNVIPQTPGAPGWIAGHSALYLELQ
jgi:hypothetical protein